MRFILSVVFVLVFSCSLIFSIEDSTNVNTNIAIDTVKVEGETVYRKTLKGKYFMSFKTELIFSATKSRENQFHIHVDDFDFMKGSKVELIDKELGKIELKKIKHYDDLIGYTLNRKKYKAKEIQILENLKDYDIVVINKNTGETILKLNEEDKSMIRGLFKIFLNMK